MVTKGTGNKKREEQAGWIGSLVPNELITTHLFNTELTEIETKEARLQEIETELTELVEATKVEESDEEIALSEALNEREDAFLIGSVRSELRAAEEDSTDYTLLTTVESLLNERTALNREIKKLKTDLKEMTEEYIETLTDEEIDTLMYEKWFGSVISKVNRLLDNPLTEELVVLEQLQDRYSDTRSEERRESNKLEKELEAMMEQLVVSE